MREKIGIKLFKVQIIWAETENKNYGTWLLCKGRLHYLTITKKPQRICKCQLSLKKSINNMEHDMTKWNRASSFFRLHCSNLTSLGRVRTAKSRFAVSSLKSSAAYWLTCMNSLSFSNPLNAVIIVWQLTKDLSCTLTFLPYFALLQKINTNHFVSSSSPSPSLILKTFSHFKNNCSNFIQALFEFWPILD